MPETIKSMSKKTESLDVSKTTEEKDAKKSFFDNNPQILEDMSKLVKSNNELNKACESYEDEINYLKLREKKIMYLVHLL